MKIQGRWLLLAGGLLVSASLIALDPPGATPVGCTPAERQEAKTILDAVLSASQIGCIESSALTSVPEVAALCKIDLQAAPQLQAVLDRLLAQKAAAMRVGFVWTAPDAGS